MKLKNFGRITLHTLNNLKLVVEIIGYDILLI